MKSIELIITGIAYIIFGIGYFFVEVFFLFKKLIKKIFRIK
jgi:hypothetical protein